MVGQGLFDHAATLDAQLRSLRPRPFVYQADSPAASEDAGIPPRHSSEGMQAKMILMGVQNWPPDEATPDAAAVPVE